MEGRFKRWVVLYEASQLGTGCLGAGKRMMIKQGPSPSRGRKRTRSIDAGWSARQRLAFIETRLFWCGRINRADLASAFGIHISAASKDLTDYQNLAPRNAVYDKSAKVYKTGPRFAPVLTTPAMDHLFGHTLLGDGIPAPRPLFEWVRPPLRETDPVIVRNVIEAAKDALAIKIFYRSMSHPEGRWRWIEPRNIAFNGHRWHCRAWCCLENEFRDFNLGRIGHAQETMAAQCDERDDAWETLVDVAIRPHRALTQDQADLVADDFDMEDGRLVLPSRQALLGYLFVNLGLDRDLDPPRQVIELEDPGLVALVHWLDQKALPHAS